MNRLKIAAAMVIVLCTFLQKKSNGSVFCIFCIKKAGTAVLAFCYFYLYHQDKKQFLKIWAISWSIDFTRYIFMLGIILWGKTPFLLICNQSASPGNGYQRLFDETSSHGRYGKGGSESFGCKQKIITAISTPMSSLSFNYAPGQSEPGHGERIF